MHDQGFAGHRIGCEILIPSWYIIVVALEVTPAQLLKLAMSVRSTHLARPSQLIFATVQSRRLVLDRHIAAGSALVLPADVVGYLLVLGLLEGALIVLLALAHDVLLHPVDAAN